MTPRTKREYLCERVGDTSHWCRLKLNECADHPDKLIAHVLWVR